MRSLGLFGRFIEITPDELIESALDDLCNLEKRRVNKLRAGVKRRASGHFKLIKIRVEPREQFPTQSLFSITRCARQAA